MSGWDDSAFEAGLPDIEDLTTAPGRPPADTAAELRAAVDGTGGRPRRPDLPDVRALAEGLGL